MFLPFPFDRGQLSDRVDVDGFEPDSDLEHAEQDGAVLPGGGDASLVGYVLDEGVQRLGGDFADVKVTEAGEDRFGLAVVVAEGVVGSSLGEELFPEFGPELVDGAGGVQSAVVVDVSVLEAVGECAFGDGAGSVSGVGWGGFGDVAAFAVFVAYPAGCDPASVVELPAADLSVFTDR